MCGRFCGARVEKHDGVSRSIARIFAGGSVHVNAAFALLFEVKRPIERCSKFSVGTTAVSADSGAVAKREILAFVKVKSDAGKDVGNVAILGDVKQSIVVSSHL